MKTKLEVNVVKYGYVRATGADPAGLELQERTLRECCPDIDLVFTERGVTGNIPLEERPVGRQLFDGLKQGDTVVIPTLDRAFRNAADAISKVGYWKQQGVELIVASLGQAPVTSDVAFFEMLRLVAQFERERFLERTAEGRKLKASAGGHVGGSAPFGYRVEGAGKNAKLIEIPEQQAAIQTMLKHRKVLSLRRIAALVQEEHGIKISHEGVRHVFEDFDRGSGPA